MPQKSGESAVESVKIPQSPSLHIRRKFQGQQSLEEALVNLIKAHH